MIYPVLSPYTHIKLRAKWGGNDAPAAPVIDYVSCKLVITTEIMFGTWLLGICMCFISCICRSIVRMHIDVCSRSFGWYIHTGGCGSSYLPRDLCTA